MIRWMVGAKLVDGLAVPRYGIISHKFYFGQGATLRMQLTKRTYAISIETIWEDYSLVEIQGLSGEKNYKLYELGSQCWIQDSELDPLLSEQISIRLKIPEDYSYDAEVHGSLKHVEGAVPSKMRSNGKIAVKLLGEGGCYTATNLQAQQLDIQASKADVDIGQLLVGTASINCRTFKGQKLSIAKQLQLKAAQTIKIRSLIMQDSVSRLSSKYCDIESIMGAANIDSGFGLKVKRWYAPADGIQAESEHYSVGVETGSGILSGAGTATLGRLHKGRILQDVDGTRHILDVKDL